MYPVGETTLYIVTLVTVFFTFNPIRYSVFGSVRKEAQLPLHFFPQGRRLFEAHPTPKLE